MKRVIHGYLHRNWHKHLQFTKKYISDDMRYLGKERLKTLDLSILEKKHKVWGYIYPVKVKITIVGGGK